MKNTEIIELAQSWIGKNERDGSHKMIIDIYNTQRPLPRGYAVKYTDSWCATFISALAVKCGCTDIIPTECSCSYMIGKFQQLGCWDENDARVPNPGDIIFYNWSASNNGDCSSGADHVGIVESVSGNNITIIEGNYHDAVARRNIKVNYHYIRGYGVPKYESRTNSEWKQDSRGWYYEENGVRVKNRWVEDRGGWCYIGADGYMITDKWAKDSKHWYYMDKTGHFTKNKWVKDSKDWCYVDEDGWLTTNAWVKDSKGWCFVKDDGRLLREGWASDNKGKHYLDSTGHIKE